MSLITEQEYRAFIRSERARLLRRIDECQQEIDVNLKRANDAVSRKRGLTSELKYLGQSKQEAK